MKSSLDPAVTKLGAKSGVSRFLSKREKSRDKGEKHRFPGHHHHETSRVSEHYFRVALTVSTIALAWNMFTHAALETFTKTFGSCSIS